MNRRGGGTFGRLAATLLGLSWLVGACGLSQLSPGTDGDAVAQLRPVSASEASAPMAAQPSAAAEPAPTPVPGLGSTRSGPGRPRWVRVRPGDTLWGIAARRDIYGSGWCYPLLIHANARLLPDPAHPRAGIRLKVPRDVSPVRVEMAEEEAMTGQLLGRGRPRAAARPAVAPSPVPEPATPVPTAQATVQPSPEPTQAPPAVPTPFPTPAPEQPAAPPAGFGMAGWILALMVVAAFAALIWILRRGHDDEK